MSSKLLDLMMMKSENNATCQPREPATADRTRARILAALDGIRYGAVEIIIHDGKVVQIERKERLRLEK